VSQRHERFNTIPRVVVIIIINPINHASSAIARAVPRARRTVRHANHPVRACTTLQRGQRREARVAFGAVWKRIERQRSHSRARFGKGRQRVVVARRHRACVRTCGAARRGSSDSRGARDDDGDDDDDVDE
jgi:hypothetical protein